MADVIKKATNKFTKGLVMDFSPENTQNEILTHALNATLLTFNGNELSLQNDMGNARVETAFLPEGYMPVGTCEYGGIVYIVSYNPLEDKSQIGCFPSPERNISREELGNDSNITIENSDFQDLVSGSFDGNLSNTTKYVILRNDNLNPGDKFLISSGDSIYQECLEGLKKTQDGVTGLVEHPVIALNVVSIEESGKIVYLNSDLRQYSVAKEDNTTYSYHVLGTKEGGVTNIKSEDLDAYRTTLSSGYNVFRSKTSGKLAILAELITIDSYSVTHSIQPRRDENGEIIDGYFDVVIHTEVSPEVTEQNYTTVPKLKYYYLDKSQGFIQTGDGKYTLFNNGELNTDFLGLNLQQLYVPTVEGSIDFNYTLGNVGEFNFPKPKTYHGHVSTISLSQFDSVSGYSKFEEGKFHRVNSSQIIDNLSYYERTLNARFYRYQSTDAEYKEYNEDTINEAYTYYVQTTAYSYEDAKRNEVTYKSRTLYKVSIEPEIAKEEQIVDKEVEKFKNITVETYIEATDEDYESGKDLWKKEGETYSEVATRPDDFYTSDGKYFTKEVKKVLVSVGFEVENTNEIFYYYPKNKQVYVEATSSDLADYWNFDKYQLTENPPYGCPIVLYARNQETVYRRATADEIYNNKELGVQLYYKAEYVNIFASEVENFEYVFVSIPMDVYIPKDTFTPNSDYNYISGEEAPNDEIPAGDPITLYDVNDFIPSPEEDYAYNDLKLGNIKIPNVVSVNGLDLPFKYDYTIVPCMNYGKLPHLAVSNTVDFSKLHAFNQSNFNIWKYRIDGNQLRLTFGTEVFDTYETNKVDAVILEFYDLWGFAGSLEITNKKSYTGTFTKILDLNALNSLSTKKISGGGYTYNYARNVNIQEVVHGDPDGGFKFGGKEIVFTGHDSGWKYADGTELGDNNDCGALYSNIIYGVKTYFRRPDGEIYEFIRKDDLFMFTLPIYNDYYYTVDNYNTLENPQLELFLTYKLIDNSVKVPLEYDDIKNGLIPSDTESVELYTSGNYTLPDLEFVKYFKYEGTTEVQLELGLKSDYQQLNVSYSPELNKFFECELRLLSDDSDTRNFTVKAEDTVIANPDVALNYNNKDNINLSLESVNSIGFGPTKESRRTLIGLQDVNFITSTGPSSVSINYEFVVGYKVNIKDIVETKIPATTVCALYHKMDSGEYNMSDFGIYTKEDSEGNTLYLSETVIYTGGTSNETVLGLCRQISTTASTITAQCNVESTFKEAATAIQNPGKHGTSLLENLLPKLGKLSFFQPHAYVMDDDTGINVDDYGGNHIIVEGSPEPWSLYKNNPSYGVIVNTLDMFKYKSELLSVRYCPLYAIDLGKFTIGYTYKWFDVWGKAPAVESTNKALLKTMSSVYAYNPDYDTLTVRLGDVSVTDAKITYTTNLVNTRSELHFPDNTTLNNYVYFGPICVKNYLDYLQKYSTYSESDKITTVSANGNIIPQVEFKPNYTFCGLEDAYYLISSLTYNTPAPTDLGSEFSYNAPNLIMVRHSDGTVSSVSGELDKKVLYGFYNGKLLQLDVDNYNIKADGALAILPNGRSDTTLTNTKELYISPTLIGPLYNGGYTYNMKDVLLANTNTQSSSLENLDISIKISFNNPHYCIAIGSSDFDPSFIVCKPTPNPLTCKVTASVNNKLNGFTYSAKVREATLRIAGMGLDSKVDPTGYTGNYEYNLHKLSYYDLYSIAHGADVTIKGPVSGRNRSSLDWIKSQAPYLHTLYFDYYPRKQDDGTYKNDYIMTYGGVGSFALYTVFDDGIELQQNKMSLFYISISSLVLEITKTRNYFNTPDSIIYVTPTPRTTYGAFTNAYSDSDNRYLGQSAYDVRSTWDSARLRGTTITLNDLIYSPIENHRLYVDRAAYQPFYGETKIWFRSLSDEGSWDASTKSYNGMNLFRGPCYYG